MKGTAPRLPLIDAVQFFLRTVAIAILGVPAHFYDVPAVLLAGVGVNVLTNAASAHHPIWAFVAGVGLASASVIAALLRSRVASVERKTDALVAMDLEGRPCDHHKSEAIKESLDLNGDTILVTIPALVAVLLTVSGVGVGLWAHISQSEGSRTGPEDREHVSGVFYHRMSTDESVAMSNMVQRLDAFHKRLDGIEASIHSISRYSIDSTNIDSRIDRLDAGQRQLFDQIGALPRELEPLMQEKDLMVMDRISQLTMGLSSLANTISNSSGRSVVIPKSENATAAEK
jgi:hypothetical protein